eukprot:4954417-Pyramimonas_sp.AAC.1
MTIGNGALDSSISLGPGSGPGPGPGMAPWPWPGPWFLRSPAAAALGRAARYKSFLPELDVCLQRFPQESYPGD